MTPDAGSARQERTDTQDENTPNNSMLFMVKTGATSAEGMRCKSGREHEGGSGERVTFYFMTWGLMTLVFGCCRWDYVYEM